MIKLVAMKKPNKSWYELQLLLARKKFNKQKQQVFEDLMNFGIARIYISK